jgi:hypothetical protein
MINYRKKDGKTTFHFQPFNLYGLFALITAMIGYQIHNSVGWAIFDFFLSPLVWMKWLVFHEVNLTIIKETFSFFFK